MLSPLSSLLVVLLLVTSAGAQVPAANRASEMAPTWETRRQAGTYVLGIPAPRGLIVDRDGAPLAQTRVSYNIAIKFPEPLNFSDAEVLEFVRQQCAIARSITGREVSVADQLALKYYRNRGMLPMDIVQDLKPIEVGAMKERAPADLTLNPVYVRFYPDGKLAGHILGYAGKTSRAADGPLQNNDLLWPEIEGRDGLEQTFNDQLKGRLGQMNITLDAARRKTSEQVAVPPQPGYNVVTTLSERIQTLAEQALEKSGARGALVVVDPNNGDILAMASWPVFNPNAFVPSISQGDFDALNNDPALPLFPRAFRSGYPPGSTFKVFVGLAALQSGVINGDDEFNCPRSMEIGRLVFRNWKKQDAGMLNFVGALTQSCNTWFYQVGIKTGAQTLTDWSLKLGLGVKTGIPLASETDGRIPTRDYMEKVYRRPMYDGDVANLSIGQGDTLISPLQMAQAMATIANGGTLYQTRLVKQVQTVDGKIVTAYNVRARDLLDIRPSVIAQLKRAMVSVVESGAGTGGKARVRGIEVAGKTGTAQWGPKNKERTAAWFAGFAPADAPEYAFAAVYEGNPNDDEIHGGTYAAPLIGRVLKELFQPSEKKKKSARPKAAPSEREEARPAEEPQ
jgi:penicillin-binding protein 2